MAKQHIFPRGIQSSIHKLDKLTGGFYSGDLIVIAGLPSVGKSPLSLSIARYATISNKLHVALFFPGISKSQLVARLVCAEAGINSRRMKNSVLTKGQLASLEKAKKIIAGSSLAIFDMPTMTVSNVAEESRICIKKSGLDLIIVDYLQLLNDSMQNGVQDFSIICHDLKKTAEELKIPIIVHSRLLYLQNTEKPQLSDLIAMGEAQNADVVLLMHRMKIARNGPNRQNPVEIIVAKNSHGGTGNVQWKIE